MPKDYRRTVFESLHNLSHPSIHSTQSLLTTRYVWPSIQSDIRKWTCTCLQCQKSKIQRRTRSPLSTFAIPSHRFYHVHIDIVGPLWFQLHVDLYRPIHMLARSISYGQHHCGDMRIHIRVWVDCTIWRPRNDYL